MRTMKDKQVTTVSVLWMAAFFSTALIIVKAFQ